MKKRICILIFFLICGIAATAGKKERPLDITDIRFNKQGSRVDLSFNINVGKRVVRNGAHLLVTPILMKEGQRMELPLIVIEGKNARPLRKADGQPLESVDGSTVYLKNKQQATYQAAIAFESWMRGADLLFETTDISCCSTADAESELIARDVMNPGNGVREFILSKDIQNDPGNRTHDSTGDRLASLYSFVMPLEDFDPQINGTADPFAVYAASEVDRSKTERFIGNTQEGALIVYFRQGSHKADPAFRNNAASLDTLYRVVREICDAKDCKVAHIIIAGFVSPEGTVRFNDRLAWDRSITVKGLLEKNTPLKGEQISTYNGTVNWYKLRRLVMDSDMEDKARVISIIESAPIESTGLRDNRLEQLKRLNNGKPYRYMLDKLFPMLRNAAYIKVYYESDVNR